MVDQFVCPYQKTEGFSFSVCRHCKALEINRGKHFSVSCRENRERLHKIAFESAYLLNYLNYPWEVEIVAEKEPRPLRR